ncbi:MAG: Holliday junction resolvase RecU [Synergistaceae bacterium]|jgi:penicillin-binding protein-related factor A (putative recombinase)|nr:Holliday junction resolvase RecU [Synergistaceae bacterium]
MRKGHIFENELAKIIDHLNKTGIHAHKNHARRTVDGTYIEGEPFDYEVFAHGRLHCFDAKECHASRWNLSNAKLSQIKHLLNCKRHGADAFFLVLFTPGRVKKFDVELVRNALADGKRSLMPEEGDDWDWTELRQ